MEFIGLLYIFRSPKDFFCLKLLLELKKNCWQLISSGTKAGGKLIA